MVTGLFAKARSIVLGNFHSILDKAVDMNSIPVLEQHLRDLQAAREDLEGELAEQRSDLKTLSTGRDRRNAEIDELTNNAKMLMGQNGGNPSEAQRAAAKDLAVKIVRLQGEGAAEAERITDTSATVEKLKTAVDSVVAKERQYQTQLGALQARSQTSAAKGKAASAIEAAGNAMAAGGNLDGLTDRIRRNEAREDARFDRALEGLGVDKGNAAVVDAKADELLASLTTPKASNAA